MKLNVVEFLNAVHFRKARNDWEYEKQKRAIDGNRD
jgi:hypothetical protein